MMILLITSSLLISACSCTLGIDVSVFVSEDQARCLVKNEQQRFAVVRGYHSYGAPDRNVGPTVKNLWAGGFSDVDVYMFPCPRCKTSAASQVAQLAGALEGVRFGMVWLDIEGGSTYWHNTHSDNQLFFSQLLAAAKQHFKVGVYANENSWSQIMGVSYPGGSSQPLWYAHYDNNPSFGDFRSFGGWSRPAIKQFNDNGNLCGVSYDKNWYP